MSVNILKVLNIEASERQSVLLLLLQSVFIGVYFGSISICAETLITQDYGHQMIQAAIFVSGFTGILLTILYSIFQSRVSFSIFSVTIFALISIATLLLRFGFALPFQKTLVFVLFVLFGPLHIIAQVIFWGSVTRILSLRQGKRLFGIIDIGWAIGIIIATVSPLVLYQFDFKTRDLLIFSIISIAGATLLQLFIIRLLKNVQEDDDTATIEDETTTVSFGKMVKDKYLGHIIAFFALSVATLLFIYSSFLEVSTQKYPLESERAQFFSAVLLTMMVFSILLKLFAYGNLLKTYGLKVGLLITPVVIGIITIITSVTGSFGHSLEAKAFIFFFLLMALSRVLSFSLNFSIEKPSFKLLYQSIDKKIRYDVQAKVDGTVNELSFLISGGLLLVMGAISYFQVIHYSYALAVIILVWIFIGIRLHRQYKKSLENALGTAKSTSRENNTTNPVQKMYNLVSASSVADPDRKYYLDLLQQVDPMYYENVLPGLFDTEAGWMKQHALGEIGRLHLISAGEILKKYQSGKSANGLKEEVQDYVNRFDKKIKQANLGQSIEKYVKSRDENERLFIARYIARSGKEDDLEYLGFLLRDLNPLVKRAAMKTVADCQARQYLFAIGDNIHDQNFYRQAIPVLCTFGNDGVETLDQQYNKTETNLETKIRIVKALGDIGGEKSIKTLVAKLNEDNFRLLVEIARSLKKCQYTPAEKDRPHFVQSLQLIISVIAYMFSALWSAREENALDELTLAIEEEIELATGLLYEMLAVCYDANSVAHVKENMDAGTSESIGFGIELLDLFIAEELKPTLIPLLEDTSLGEKVRRLQVEFPVDKMSIEKLLTSIINKNINHISRYTKACAMINSIKLDQPDMDTLVSQLFNQDELLYKTAALVLFNHDQEVFMEAVQRLDNEKQTRVKAYVDNIIGQQDYLVTEIVSYLKKNDYFAGISGDLLTRVAGKMDLKRLEAGASLKVEARAPVSLVIVFEGKLILDEGEEQEVHLKKGSIWKFRIHDNNHLFKAVTDASILIMNKSEFNNLIYDHEDFFNLVIGLENEKQPVA